MKTFNYESNYVKYKNCFFDVGKYEKGKLSLAIYDYVENDKEISYISNVTVNVEEEMTQIMNLEPDLILTDMKMPKRTVLEVIELIQCNQFVSKIPKFVLITDDRDYKIIEKSRKLGFDIEYKPIDQERIKQIIDDFEIGEK